MTKERLYFLRPFGFEPVFFQQPVVLLKQALCLPQALVPLARLPLGKLLLETQRRTLRPPLRPALAWVQALER